MSFFERRINCRITKRTDKMIRELLKKKSDKFDDESDVVRVAIIQLHRNELPDSKLKPEMI